MAMSSIKMVFASLVLAAVPSVAVAQSGAEVGVRTGYAFAAGHTGALANSDDSNLGDWISGQWPIWIDVGYRFNPSFYLGGYFQYGFGFVNEDHLLNGCRNANFDCSASDTRLGVMGRYHFVPAWHFSPWVGLGFGYEWEKLSIHESVSSTTSGIGWSGFEFANLQVGADYEIASRFVIGPFLSLSFGQYRNWSVTTPVGPSSGTREEGIAKESIHEWILIGVRAAFKP
jgi:opacity protein-like surface antigen